MEVKNNIFNILESSLKILELAPIWTFRNQLHVVKMKLEDFRDLVHPRFFA